MRVQRRRQRNFELGFEELDEEEGFDLFFDLFCVARAVLKKLKELNELLQAFQVREMDASGLDCFEREFGYWNIESGCASVCGRRDFVRV